MLSLDGGWPPVATASVADTLAATERRVHREVSLFTLSSVGPGQPWAW
jgi:hypothetical protein